ncbi:RidA family protein [Dyadobacter arcticus]|uniref:Enamine deaminase RidA (YjgF/YER057c/UK114 family) n=1 Tax=Dyadobacter arcticus TaxID=1078754 RepID=A0ABX0UUA2_9BACT|nr:RidA family protein [Dyadobacter arcticus]NIJ55325.1 enamine deaminase RidA (YjgF/YER057c/UK114 family) [Dyadobacter arcticus]
MKIFILPLLLLACTSFGQIVKFSNPATVAKPNGYSHAAIIDLGNSKMVIISGQIALDKQGNLVGKDDMGKQAEQVFANIKSIVEDAGGTMNDLVKLNYFLLDVAQIQAVRNVRDKYVNVQNPPASTLVQVSKLFRDGFLLEIEATAVISKK